MEINFSKNAGNPATPVVEVAATVTPLDPAKAVPGVITEGTTPTPMQETSTAVIVAPPKAVAKNDNLLLGDVLPSFSEMILPRVNLVQNIGAMKDSFESGSLVHDQRTVLFIPGRINEKTRTVERVATPPVTMTFIGFRPTRFVEKVPGGGKGLIVDTEEQVCTNGGTLDYGEWKLKEKAGMKRFEPLADGMVVIERPEICVDDDTVFVYAVDGKKYALALWAVRGTSYTALCKRVLFPARRLGALRHGGFPSWSYSLSANEVTFGVNMSWIPVALPRAKNTDAFLAFVKDVLTGGGGA